MHGVVEYDISSVKGPLANAFLILINALFFNVKLIGLQDVYPRDYSQQLLNAEDSVFDFVIVGAGAAGCVAANRISENEQWSVLLIEAGDYPIASSDVPGLYRTFRRTKEDWTFVLEKEKRACLSMVGGRCTLTKGKVLGGTSTVNNLRYVRGTPENYDKNDLPDWSSNVTYSIFEKLENYVGDESMPLAYGTSGPIFLHLVNFTEGPREMLQDAYRSTGYMRMPKRSFIGFTEHLVYMKNGERYNMAKAFLTPVKERPNLFFTKNTEVEGIVITEPIDKRVSGVNVSIDGVKFFIRARKEVILTAGAINNAKLLLVSGIGPRDYLTAKKIPMVSNLPGVGKNLQFHLSVPIYVALGPCEGCSIDYYREIDLINDVFDYVMHRTGNLSTVDINEFANFINTVSDDSMPDVSIHHLYFKAGDVNLLAFLEGMNYIPRIVKAIMAHNQERPILTFYITVLNPISRGAIFLNDTHHLGGPKIVANFMSDDEDKDFTTLFSAFDYITNLTQTPAMQKHKAEFLNLDIPNCRNIKFCTIPYVKCYIHNMAYPKWDAVGTLRMGSECEPLSVVKEDLEVKNVRCLRVADSSVLGYIPVGNTVATDAMIGYNLAEILNLKWVKDYHSSYLRANVSEPNEEPR